MRLQCCRLNKKNFLVFFLLLNKHNIHLSHQEFSFVDFSRWHLLDERQKEASKRKNIIVTTLHNIVNNTLLPDPNNNNKGYLIFRNNKLRFVHYAGTLWHQIRYKQLALRSVKLTMPQGIFNIFCANICQLDQVSTSIACFDLSDLADNEDDTCKEEEKVEGGKAKNDRQTSTK